MTGRALWITGASGFVGRRVLAELARRGAPAVQLGRRAIGSGPFAALDLESAALAPPGTPVVDVADLPEPTGLLHLAALSFPPACEAEPQRALAINVGGVARLYEQFLAAWPDTPVLHVSTAQVYKPQAEPLREADTGEPVNHYGASKLQGEAVARGMRARGHQVTVARPFNHTAAGQAADFALPSFSLRLARLERDGGGELAVGNLAAVRDFLHADQVAKAYLDLLAAAPEHDTINVCSGTGTTMQALLDGLIERVSAPVTVQTDDTRLRGAKDPLSLVGNPARLAEVLGEAPQLDRAALLDELMDDARQRVESGEDLARA